MEQLSKRFLTIALAVASLAGVSLVLGLDASPAGAATAALSFNHQPGGGRVNTGWASQPSVTITSGGSSTDTITLSITGSPAGVTLTCADSGTNGDSMPAVGSVAAFSGCAINTAGTYTLTATDTPAGGARASSPFTIFGPAHMLAFTTEPGNGTVNLPLSTQPVVDVEDVGGNLVADSTDSITLSITGSPAGVTLTCADSGTNGDTKAI